jgi:hypothetical protein
MAIIRLDTGDPDYDDEDFEVLAEAIAERVDQEGSGGSSSRTRRSSTSIFLAWRRS